MILTNWILRVTENYIHLRLYRARYEKPLFVGKQYLEEYSSSNAALAAPDPEERAVLFC